MPDFSTPAEHAFESSTVTFSSSPSSSSTLPLHSLLERYEVPSTISEILAKGYKTIALQFPDEMLGDSVVVYRALMKGIRRGREGGSEGNSPQCFVLGDSTYGACCPDILSSMHLPADFLVHYGHACLTATQAIPVRYVFPKLDLDISSSVSSLFSTAFPPSTSPSSTFGDDDGDSPAVHQQKAILLLWDVAYDHLSSELSKSFIEASEKYTKREGGREGGVQVFVGKIDKERAAAVKNKTKGDEKRDVEGVETGGGGGCGSDGCGSGNTCASLEVASSSHEVSGSGCGNGNGGCASGCSSTATASTSQPANDKDNEGEGEENDDDDDMEEPGLENLGGAQVGIPENFKSKADTSTSTPSPQGADACTALPSIQETTASLRIYPFPSGLDISDCIIFYIGEESRGLVNLMMENSQVPVYQYAPSTGTTVLASARTSLLLSRRLFALHRAFTASTFGILVHNVGLSKSHSIVSSIRRTLKKHGKKSYTISVGRLNPAKLANFEVVECWVLVGCLEGGLVDQKEYYRPIITPWELSLALKGEQGTWAPEKWTLDFEKVMEETHHLMLGDEEDGDNENSDNERDEDAPVFSLASGQYHTSRKFSKQDPLDDSHSPKPTLTEQDQALVIKNKNEQLIRREGVDNVAGNYLATRSWQGLDPNEGLEKGDGISSLEQGRVGIARGYGHEKDGD